MAAVSGGPDSIALLHALRGLPYPCRVVHVNHHLRAGATADARLVRRLCASWGLPYEKVSINVRSAAKRLSLGIEETARLLRYDCFQKVARKRHCRAILTAHHADDQAETVLFNWLRGAGLRGWGGIRPVRPMGDSSLKVVRPLLSVTRQALRDYCRDHHLPFRLDPSNRDVRFKRNWIRHKLLPLLVREFPGLPQRLAQAASLARDEEDFWQGLVATEFAKTVRQNKQKIRIDLRNLLKYHKALGRRLIRAALPGLSFQEIERVFALAHEPKTASPLLFPGALSVSKQRQQLVIAAKRGSALTRDPMRNV